MVEWGRLLSGYRGEIFGRRFESCPPRYKKKRAHHRTRFCFNLEVEQLKNYSKLNFIPKCVPLNPRRS